MSQDGIGKIWLNPRACAKWNPEKFEWVSPYSKRIPLDGGNNVGAIIKAWRDVIGEIEQSESGERAYFEKKNSGADVGIEGLSAFPYQCYLYFLYSSHAHLVKIGISSSPETRVRGIQMMCPVPLAFLGMVRCHSLHEKMLHLALADYRKHGEWFVMNKVITDLIDRANDEGIRAIHDFIESQFYPANLEIA